ncbi:phosphonate metabolism protein/1,5-bisphosphokinase (PRPP-forming) PhnN (plasmid) [Rhodobacteraceae bacterium SC52]|nr:phosphonate metabolism protein/1,5-bisphosphokinase (PRPP-forming) PhnN [Rhodobacteraceae bacterium SC52]
MRRGRLIAVVGPSGVGKDSVMEGLVKSVPGLQIARRCITRAACDSTETFQSISVDQFEQLCCDNAFALHWDAHGLRYGIPHGALSGLADGQDVLVNLSRSVLNSAATKFRPCVVISLSAAPDILAQRLHARGRETASRIAARLTRSGTAMPVGVQVISIANNGALADTVSRARGALYPLTETRVI